MALVPASVNDNGMVTEIPNAHVHMTGQNNSSHQIPIGLYGDDFFDIDSLEMILVSSLTQWVIGRIPYDPNGAGFIILKVAVFISELLMALIYGKDIKKQPRKALFPMAVSLLLKLIPFLFLPLHVEPLWFPPKMESDLKAGPQRSISLQTTIDQTHLTG